LVPKGVTTSTALLRSYIPFHKKKKDEQNFGWQWRPDLELIELTREALMIREPRVPKKNGTCAAIELLRNRRTKPSCRVTPYTMRPLTGMLRPSKAW
jgi:hypothetical protein